MPPDTSLRGLVAQAAEAGGGKVHSACSATPRELLEAFGLEVRRLAPPGTVASGSRGEALSGPAVCAWCKSALGSAEAGDLWVGGATCDQMRRSLELAGRTTGVTPLVIHAPKTRTLEAEAFYGSELAWLAGELERLKGRALDPEELRRAIKTRNAIRRRIRELRPLLSGPEFVSLIHLDSLLAAGPMAAFLESRVFARSDNAKGLPVLVAGSPLTPDDLRWLDRLEAAGFRLAADATCTGDRAVDFVVDEDGDPMAALARAYFRRPPCVYVRPNDEFYEYAARLVRDRGVRAVVWRSVRGCDLYALEAQRAERRLGLPFLALDMSCGDADAPRVSTRIEAFAESLR